MPIEYILIGVTLLLITCIFASKASSLLGVPSLLIFLLVGMLVGSDGLGIHFDDPVLTQAIGVVALSFILFSGGLDTNWESIRPVLWKGVALSSAGVLVTALLVGWFVSAITEFSFLEGLLLGAIVSSTDAAAVFSILRSRNVSLRKPLKPLLELESGSNDPMAVFLTIGVIGLIMTPGFRLVDMVPLFILQASVGAAAGYVMGRMMTYTVNRLQLEYDGLYPVLTLSFVLLIYGASAALGGNGFLSVYIAGLVMGKSDFLKRRSILSFHDGLAWLMQIGMFLTLGLLVFPSRLVPIIGVGLLISAFLIIVARPASVFLTLYFFKVPFRDKALVSWVGLRGAVPIILATFPFVSGIAEADLIFHIVFFIVLTSALVQGTTIPIIAKLLKVTEPFAPETFQKMAEQLKSELTPIEVPESSAVIGKKVVDAGFPKGVLIVFIWRDDKFIVPDGRTVLEKKDKLFVLTDRSSFDRIKAVLSEKR
ncbi:MAG: potassium/proton antiporter [Thermodesulfobacteriota bacterium]|nr:MAG: potassium/proton antiporter [Thermodesulfobacteriota bacterium]